MTLLAALLLAPQTPSTAAEFFPLVPGERRIYEARSGGEKVTLIEEVGAKPAYFDGAEAFAVLQKSQFNQVLGTDYFRVEGPTVLLVGRAEERTSDAKRADGTFDLSKPRVRKTVLLQLLPAMPVFRYDGGPTVWTYGEVPVLKAVGDAEPVKTDPTAIRGTTKPGPTKTVLGRKVETIEVRAEIQIGQGSLGRTIVETAVYGRGIGRVESSHKESGGGSKPFETRTILVGIEKAVG